MMSHTKADSFKQPMPPINQATDSSIEKKLFSEETNPSSSETTSYFGYGQPSFQNEQPSFQYDDPSFQNNKPSFQNDQPSFQHDNPSIQNDQPSFQNDQPSSHHDVPSFHGDNAEQQTNGDGLKTEDSDLWKIGANSNVEETPGGEDNSVDEMRIVLSEELGNLATELRDEVMMMKPSLQQQEDQDETIVTKAQLLLRDAVQYRQKLAAIKDQYSARLDQVSSSLSARSQD